MNDRVIKVFSYDPEVDRLASAIEAAIYEHGAGIPLAVVVGAIEITKQSILMGMRESGD